MSIPKSSEGSCSSLYSTTSSSVRSSYFRNEHRDGTVSADDFNLVSNRITNLSLGQSRGNEPNKKCKVSCAVQTCDVREHRNKSFLKERKRWARPPLVGQSSTDEKNEPLRGIETSASEDEVKPHISVRGDLEVFMVHQVSESGEHSSEKTLGSSTDQSLPAGDGNDIQRAPSPSSISSIASRRLEWDSGADVGYYHEHGVGTNELSSIERMVIDKGRVKVPSRCEPEGKSSTRVTASNSTIINVIGAPTCESTPVSLTRNTETISGNSGQNRHLFPEVIVEVKGCLSDSSCDINPKSGPVVDKPPVKKSFSLDNFVKSKLNECSNATFPRSLSQAVSAESQGNPVLHGIVNPPQSISSSSVATVVTGTPRKSSKHVQTSYHIQNIGTQSSPTETERDRPISNQNYSSTLESAQMSADDRVNSFEYLPGHVYENNQKSKKEKGVSLKEDVDRGVHLLEEFIQGSNANNTLMKKELIQRVVKRLISTDYPEDEESGRSVPIRCSTRRSQNQDNNGITSSENQRSAKQGNSSSLSEQTSSPAWVSVTESSKSSDNSRDPPKAKTASGKKKIGNAVNCGSGSSSDKFDWKAPATKAEQIYERKIKGINKNDEGYILEYLNSERENQLDWIVKEINHLSNLKSLLEKHEKLRRNLHRLKKARLKREASAQDNPKPASNTRRPLSGFNIPEATSKPSRPEYQEDSWESHNYDTSDKQKLKKSVSTLTQKDDLLGIRSTAYTITFEDVPTENKPSTEAKKKPMIADRQTLIKESREFVKENYPILSLQECLMIKRPDVVRRAEERRKTVAEVTAVRQLRQEKRPAVLAAAMSSDRELMPPPPPPLVKRVVSQKEMRKQTEKKYRQTFEVKKKISERKSKEALKTNRLMAEIYNKRLQHLALKGRTDLSNSLDVISTV